MPAFSGASLSGLSAHASQLAKLQLGYEARANQAGKFSWRRLVTGAIEIAGAQPHIRANAVPLERVHEPSALHVMLCESMRL